MRTIEYRLYFNDNPTTREQLDRVEEITVEQEIDMAWEARLQIPIYTDDSGNWQNENEDFMQEFSRIRVEVKVDKEPFVPLIEGPIVGYDSNRSSQPGQSTITLIVHDDSAYLNRQVRLERFDNLADHEIAEQLFGQADEIATTDIETTPPPASNLTPVVVQRGTAMQILRSLARRQGMHAYVLPGDGPGQSIGCFKPFTIEPSGLPDLILLGAERNIETFNVTFDAQSPSRVQAFALRITDKAVLSSTSNFRNLDLLGPEQAFQNEEDTAVQVSLPNQGDAVDLDQRVAAESDRDSYALEATGSVLADCYPGVLQPYNVVTVQGINDRLSGDFLINSVTHSLTRSNYSQSFTMRTNALSEGAGNDFSDLVGDIF